MAAEVLEQLLREEVTVSAVLTWLKHEHNSQVTAQVSAVKSEVKPLPLAQKDFVPFLLNFLREQTSQILTTGPATPAKTPNSKPVTSCHNESRKTEGLADKKSENAPVNRTSRTQLFSQTPNSSYTSDAFFPSSPSASSGSSFLTKSSLSAGYGGFTSMVSHSSPSFSSTPLPPNHTEKRSSQKLSLGNFIVLTPESQQVRRGKKKNNNSGNTPVCPVVRDLGQSLNDEDGGPDHLLSGSGGRIRPVGSITTSPPIPMINFLNLEDFPPVGASLTSPSKSKPSRRINPTPVSAERLLSKPKNCFTSTPLSSSPSTLLKKDTNCEVSFLAAEEAVDMASPHNSLQMEREMLKRERTKLLQLASSSSVPAIDPVTPTKSSYNPSMTLPSDSLVTSADPSKVTWKTQLELLAQLYSACITQNLVPNIFLELFFVLQLLTLRGMPSVDERELNTNFTTGLKDAVETQHFRSVHNCVFFAVQVLDCQFPVISHLDKGTLKLLTENERITFFSSSLHERLMGAYENSTAKISHLIPTYILSVSFQPETDNRSNFPSDQAFHIFKKQRDVFYELLRDWEDKHEEPGWDFERRLGNRIRSMMANLSTTFNHSHFARLFQKQLIQMCKSSVGGASASSDTPDQDVLNMLGSDNLMRLKRLQERFVSPQSTGGPCPPPSFPGYQEFFRDFILSAGSFQFNQHLTDSLCQKIMALDGISLIEHEPTDGDADTDEQDEKQHFTSVLMTLRLLAKFLGFVTFLPYRTTDPPTKGDLQESAVALRNQTVPALDVLGLLRRCIRCRRTILTVPWTVEFLSLLDHVAPFLDYYSRVFSLLLHLYRFMVLSEEEEKEMGFLNKLLIVAVLGWLFQVPTVPEEMFFTNELKQEDFSADTVASAQALEAYKAIQREALKKVSLPESDTALLRWFEDCVPLVDQQLLYICCPYLSELRKLLASFVAGSASKNGGFIRKITPTAAEPLLPKPAHTQKKLQAALEQAFFHNQPPSLRRTVEFVAERVGSNCVKHIKATLVAELVKTAEVKLKDKILESNTTYSKLLEFVCSQLYEDGRLALDRGREFCRKKGPEAVRVLLPEETSAAVMKSAEDIAVGLAIEKACTWLSANITALIKREVKDALSRMLKSQGAPVAEGSEQAEDRRQDCSAGCVHSAPLPSMLINNVKDVLCIAVGPRDNGEVVSYAHFEDLLRRLRQTLQCRKYMCPTAEQQLAKCTVEMASLLVSDRIPLEALSQTQETGKNLLEQKDVKIYSLLQLLLSIWKEDFRVPVPIHLIFSSKNVGYMAHAPVHQWEIFLFMLRGLLQNGLLKYPEAEKHLRSLHEFSWPSNFLEDLDLILSIFLSECKAETVNQSRENEAVPPPIGTLIAQS